MKPVAKILSRITLLIGLAAAAFTQAAAADLHPNDVARFLAGYEPSSGSPLAKYAQNGSWKRHASQFDRAWKKVDASRLSKARAWAGSNLSANKPAMFYMFSGPDFLFATTFYPNASTYILTGLEPVGAMPSVRTLTNSGNLAGLRHSMSSVLNYSFFITKHMRTQLNSGLKGTLPVIFVFMARTGHTIDKISYVKLDGKGGVAPHTKGRRQGLKIEFSKGGQKKTMYYFSTNLANSGIKRSGLMEFAKTFGKGDSLLKSASYLMHSGNFTTVRQFVLDNSATIVQDPSGIPLKYFKREQWNLKPFGNYRGPIPLFKGKYQRDLAKLHKTAKAEKVNFGIGYRWRTHETSFLLAKRK